MNAMQTERSERSLKGKGAVKRGGKIHLDCNRDSDTVYTHFTEGQHR